MGQFRRFLGAGRSAHPYGDGIADLYNYSLSDHDPVTDNHDHAARYGYQNAHDNLHGVTHFAAFDHADHHTNADDYADSDHHAHAAPNGYSLAFADAITDISFHNENAA
jgi:hypothetical protein